MGKQRGGNILLGSIGVIVVIIELVVIGLIMWGLVKWFMSATDNVSKGFAIFFMISVAVQAVRILWPYDD